MISQTHLFEVNFVSWNPFPKWYPRHGGYITIGKHFYFDPPLRAPMHRSVQNWYQTSSIDPKSLSFKQNLNISQFFNIEDPRGVPPPIFGSIPTSPYPQQPYQQIIIKFWGCISCNFRLNTENLNFGELRPPRGPHNASIGSKVVPNISYWPQKLQFWTKFEHFSVFSTLRTVYIFLYFNV